MAPVRMDIYGKNDDSNRLSRKKLTDIDLICE